MLEQLHVKVAESSLGRVEGTPVVLSHPSSGSPTTAIVIPSPNGPLNGDRSSPQGIYAKKPNPRDRVLARRTSHTLLFVPETNTRRVSNVSGNSIASCASCPCPSELSEESDVVSTDPVTFSLSLSPVNSRRKSVQTGAPAIGFRPIKSFERRASQPTLILAAAPAPSPPNHPPMVDDPPNQNSAAVKTPEDKSKMLTKRVSWLSMKSLQEAQRRPSAGSARGSPSRSRASWGSQPHLLLDQEREFESDTPPLDTLSWSNAGSQLFLFILWDDVIY